MRDQVVGTDIQEDPTPNVDINYLKLLDLANEGRRFRDEAKKGRCSLLDETSVLIGKGKLVTSRLNTLLKGPRGQSCLNWMKVHGGTATVALLQVHVLEKGKWSLLEKMYE